MKLYFSRIEPQNDTIQPEFEKVVYNHDIIKEIWDQLKYFKNHEFITKMISVEFEKLICKKRYVCIS